MGSPRDQRHHEPPSPEALMREFPGWAVWKGINGRWYARLPQTSPPVMLKPGGAADLGELREWLDAWHEKHGN